MMNHTTSHNPRFYNTTASGIRTLMISLGLLAASVLPASGQEIFILSTESGLEMYQVEKLHEPDLQLNTYSGGLGTKSVGLRIMPQSGGSVYGVMGNFLMVDSGLQTTPSGRLLMLAGRTNWQPASENETESKKLVAALLATDTQRMKEQVTSRPTN